MIIIFLTLIMIASANSNKLMNNYFTSEITNNGITLNNKYKIKYDTLKETNYNYKNLYFDDINYGKDYSINSISSYSKT